MSLSVERADQPGRGAVPWRCSPRRGSLGGFRESRSPAELTWQKRVSGIGKPSLTDGHPSSPHDPSP
ncbi:[F-Actin]-Monooxygenase Mical2 [Manis pentadactyla]|nr:[F-Actin]-Monooxygenase Mical2 [Manis pentadactyla]